MKIINVEGVTKKYKSGVCALKNLSFSIDKGEFVSIVGPFGSGKTSILELLSGMVTDYEGKIKVNEGTPQLARLNRKIGYIFQTPTLFPWRNTLENIELPLEICNIKNKKLVLDLLRIVGLNNSALKMPHELSGGMQQLVSIARGLVLNPDILLLDEPFSSIDEINRMKMHQYLLKIHQETNKTMLMVTHSLFEAIYLSTKVMILTSSPGQIKNIINIDLPSRNENIIYSEKFLNYVKIIKAEMNGEN